jgi:subtilisin family serine protease
LVATIGLDCRLVGDAARLLAVLGLLLAVGALAGTARAAGLVPNDPAYQQYSEIYGQTQSELFWGATFGTSCTAAIAVLDSSPTLIPDLPNVQIGANFAPGTGDVAHGTNVASVAAAGIDNGVGVPGSSNCPVIAVRVMDASGFWSGVDLRPAIDWACAQSGVRVLNLSLWETAGETSSSAITASLQSCVDRGILPVLIAGNGASNVGPGSADPSANPLAAANPEALRVAGVDTNGQLDPRSNFGPALSDIAAPYQVPVDQPDGSWVLDGGTSFAAPAVAGVAAAMFNANPALTPAQVKEDIECSGAPVLGLNVGSLLPDGRDCRGRVLQKYNALVVAETAPTQATLDIKAGHGGTVAYRDGSASSTCSAACSTTEDVGSTIELEAVPAQGYAFVGWLGACSGTGPDCQIALQGDATVAAAFARSKARLVVRKGAGGRVESSPAGIRCGSRCAALFPIGNVVLLTATPPAGFTTKWGRPCRGTRPTCSVKLARESVVTVSWRKR